MYKAIPAYHRAQAKTDKAICNLLYEVISTRLPNTENKVWQMHPVWFQEGNPIVSYSKQKDGIRLMFWSGADFDEEKLKPGTGKFNDASSFYNEVSDINEKDLKRWLKKAKDIQWDYKNMAKRKGKLVRIV
jgi:hypothetical protein